MNRDAWSIAMEGVTAWPSSASGKDVKSDHEQDMYGSCIEEIQDSHDDDDTLDGLNRTEKCGQASIWRKKIYSAVGASGKHVLRMIYADSDEQRYIASKWVAMSMASDPKISYAGALEECLHEARLKTLEDHSHDPKEELLDRIRDATKKAGACI